VRVEDAAASGCQLDEHKKIASELAAEEDYNLRSPFFFFFFFCPLAESRFAFHRLVRRYT